MKNVQMRGSVDVKMGLLLKLERFFFYETGVS
jgi:hypothetical protein